MTHIVHNKTYLKMVLTQVTDLIGYNIQYQNYSIRWGFFPLNNTFLTSQYKGYGFRLDHYQEGNIGYYSFEEMDKLLEDIK